MLEQFHFLRPLWLIALVPLALLIWMMIMKRLGSHSWEIVCDESLLPYILIGTNKQSRRKSILLVVITGLLAILGLAGPVWEKLPQPVFSNQKSLVIALDLSLSMDANDITPSRLARARFKIADILQQRQEGQTALLVYAGDSFIVTPLTDDNATIQSQLDALTTDIMPVAGNRTDLALIQAVELLKQAGESKGEVLLINDEVDYEQTQQQAVAIRNQGYRLSILGVGTKHGVPVALADGSFLKDNNGKIVVPVLDEKPMRLLAQAGGGQYIKMTVDDKDINVLQKLFSGRNLGDDVKSTELKTDVWREQGPWLVILLLPLTALIFRRGYIVVLLLYLFPFPDTAQAFDWDSLWLRPDQQAKRALDSGDHEEAAQIFEDPAWKGVAQYQAQDFEQAARSLQQVHDIESLYNRGNALARLGKYQEAINTYEKVLEQYPEHADAKFNKELLEEELNKQQNQQQSNQKQKQQQNDQQQSKQEQDQQQNQQQDQEQGDQQQSNQSQQAMNESGDQQDQHSPEQREPAQQEPEQQAGSEFDQQEGEGNQQQQLTQSDTMPLDESQQATEQWLRRIPDDPGGLLRRKFLYQYKQRSGKTPPQEKTW